MVLVNNSFIVSKVGHNLASASTPCYAWALMTNHAHLVIRTGIVPLATLMRRLLTGYAGAFDRGHRRHGHFFRTVINPSFAELAERIGMGQPVVRVFV